MDTKSEYVAEDYLDAGIFDTKTYLDAYSGCDGEGLFHRYNKFLVSWMRNEFSSGDFSGNRMADVCSGPLILSAIFGSKIFKEILLFEFTPQCRREIWKWINKKEGAVDWTSFLRTAADLEMRAPQYIEARTRASVTDVLPIDLTKPFPLYSYPHLLPFDLLYSAFTVENVAPTEDEFKSMLVMYHSWIRPGGGLLLAVSVNQSHYELNTKRFYTLCLSESAIMMAVQGAGLIVSRSLHFHLKRKDFPRNLSCDSSSWLFLSAVKKGQKEEEKDRHE